MLRSSGPGEFGWGSKLTAVLAAALTLATGWWAVASEEPSPVAAAVRGDFPAPGHEQAKQPLGTPPNARDSTSYRFLDTQENGVDPVAYDPCRPVHFVVRDTGAPPGGRTLVTESIAAAAEATGLRFVDDGATQEPPAKERKAFQPDRYGDRWAPVLIAWVTPEENPDFAADVTGQGGSTSYVLPGKPTVYVTGQIQLDAEQLTEMAAEPGGRDLVRATIQHELGHLLGLDHVTDRRQLMYPQTVRDVTEFSAGDLAGLAALGRGACVPEL